MNPVDLLIKEHEDIERELLELETIMSEEIINYPNLIHTCKKLHTAWDVHERKEEDIFPILSKKGFSVPIAILHFDHKSLRNHTKKLNDAIKSGNDFEIHKALDEDLKDIISRLREHIKKEEDILYSVLPIDIELKI
jgi:DUF438 domain-containing protein